MRCWRTALVVWPIRGKGTPSDNGATAMRTITGSGCRASTGRGSRSATS